MPFSTPIAKAYHDINSVVDFPGGPVVKNLPSNAEDMDLVRELGSHVLCDQKKRERS